MPYSIIERVQILTVVACLLMASNRSQADNLLNHDCKPESLFDRARAYVTPASFWEQKVIALEQFKEEMILQLKLLPLEYKREMDELRYQFRKDRIEIPEMYQGDLAEFTLTAEREAIASTQQLYRELPAINREWIRWADKCIGYAQSQIR